MMNPETPISIDGNPHVITPPNLKTEGLFQDYLRKMAIQDTVRMRESFGPSYNDTLAAVTRDVNAGVYDWFGEVFWRALGTERHMQHLATFVLNQDKPVITVEDVRKHWRDRSGLKIVRDDQEIENATVGQLLAHTIQQYIARPNEIAPALPQAAG